MRGRVQQWAVCLAIALAGLAFSAGLYAESALAAGEAQIKPPSTGQVLAPIQGSKSNSPAPASSHGGKSSSPSQASSQGGNSGNATSIVNPTGGNGGNASAGSYGINVSPQTNLQVAPKGDNHASNKAVTQSHNQATGGNGGNADSNTQTRSGRGGDAVSQVTSACCPNNSDHGDRSKEGSGSSARSFGGDSGNAHTESNTTGGDGGKATAGSFGVNVSPQTNIQVAGHGDNHASNEAVTQSYNRAEGGDGGDATSEIHTRSGRGGDAESVATGACCERPNQWSNSKHDDKCCDSSDRWGKSKHDDKCCDNSERWSKDQHDDHGVSARSIGGDSGDATTESSTTGGDGGSAKAGSFGINLIGQRNLQGSEEDHKVPMRESLVKDGSDRSDGGDNRARNTAVTQSYNRAEGGDGGDAASEIHTRSGRGGDAESTATGACCDSSDRWGNSKHDDKCCDSSDRWGKSKHDDKCCDSSERWGTSKRDDHGVSARSVGGDGGDATTESYTTGGDGGSAKAGSFGINLIGQRNEQGAFQEKKPYSMKERDSWKHDQEWYKDGSDNRASNKAITQSFNRAEGGKGGDATSEITTSSGRGGDAKSEASDECCDEET